MEVSVTLLGGEIVNYGTRIKEIRESKGLKAKFVAEFLGLSSAQYCDLEKGRKKLTAELIRGIADVLGVSTDDILRPYVSETLTKPTGTEGK